jgi:hypothetical protein
MLCRALKNSSVTKDMMPTDFDRYFHDSNLHRSRRQILAVINES